MGFWEALSPGRSDFKMDRFAEVFAQIGTGGEKVVEGIFEEIRRVSSAPAEDDLTVFAVTSHLSASGVRR